MSTHVTVSIIEKGVNGIPFTKPLRVDDFSDIFSRAKTISTIVEQVHEAEYGRQFTDGSAVIDEERKVMSFSGNYLWNWAKKRIGYWEKQGWIVVTHPVR